MDSRGFKKEASWTKTSWISQSARVGAQETHTSVNMDGLGTEHIYEDVNRWRAHIPTYFMPDAGSPQPNWSSNSNSSSQAEQERDEIITKITELDSQIQGLRSDFSEAVVQLRNDMNTLNSHIRKDCTVFDARVQDEFMAVHDQMRNVRDMLARADAWAEGVNGKLMRPETFTISYQR
jgi:hypothetical protein